LYSLYELFVANSIDYFLLDLHNSDNLEQLNSIGQAIVCGRLRTTLDSEL